MYRRTLDRENESTVTMLCVPLFSDSALVNDGS